MADAKDYVVPIIELRRIAARDIYPQPEGVYVVSLTEDCETEGCRFPARVEVRRNVGDQTYEDLGHHCKRHGWTLMHKLNGEAPPRPRF
jgi:hypothetical protein